MRYVLFIGNNRLNAGRFAQRADAIQTAQTYPKGTRFAIFDTTDNGFGYNDIHATVFETVLSL